MGSWLSHLPKFNFFERNLFQSNCCNKEFRVSYTKCMHCGSKYKLYNIDKDLEHNIQEDIA
jgi:hypothetical protein